MLRWHRAYDSRSTERWRCWLRSRTGAARCNSMHADAPACTCACCLACAMRLTFCAPIVVDQRRHSAPGNMVAIFCNHKPVRRMMNSGARTTTYAPLCSSS